MFADYLQLPLITLLILVMTEFSNPLANSAGEKKLIIHVCAATLTEVPMEQSQLKKLVLSDGSMRICTTHACLEFVFVH